jgi:hypothetical protein
MKPVTIPTHGFVFCRYSIAVLVWVAFLLHSIWCLAIAGVILALSAILKVGRAPMIVLYSKTFLRFYRSPEEVVDETAMRFAHLMGTGFALACLVSICVNARFGWRLTFLFALMKTISAFGFCPASKLFTCASNTSCCPVTKRFMGVCQVKGEEQVRK